MLKDQKIKIDNYMSFNRNRKDQIMGGVSSSVRNDEKQFALKVFEGENNDEFIVTRYSQFRTPINIVAIYGEQEGRETKPNVRARWQRIMEQVRKVESKHELVVIIGDLNKHVGNDELGVKHNHPKISNGGELV